MVFAKFATTTQHGAVEGKVQTHLVSYYNLDVIISVGYRVKSKRGVNFRRWANRVLKDYLVKGYAVNEKIHKKQIGELRQLVGMLGVFVFFPLIAVNDPHGVVLVDGT